MTSVLHIDGNEYHPAVIAAKQCGYTREYILLLARQGKILGKKIENKWYVHLPSVKEYFESAEHVQEDRRRATSLERKKELEERSQHHAHTTARLARIHNRSTALAETLAVVMIGLSLGATAHIGIQANQTASVATASEFVDTLAVSLYQLVVPSSVPAVLVDTATEEVTDDTNTRSKTETVQNGVILGNSEEAIADSFSDIVKVTFDETNPLVAIVTPLFRSGEGEPHRFLLLPVGEETP